MRRREFLCGVAGTLAGSALAVRGLRAGPAGPARPPNILFILADDLGWGDLGCYGHRQIRTPHLDRLAAQGVLFTQFYVNGSVCSPTRAALLTGRFPARHRIHGHLATHEQNAARGMPDWLDPQGPMLPRLLKGAGYATAHVGKWHLGGGPGAPLPGAYGFDFARAVNAPDQAWAEGKDPLFRARSTALFVDEALGFIEANRDKPWYLQLWTLLPHATLHPTPEQMAPYQHLGAGANLPFSAPMQIYAASVADLDQQVGRLLARLQEWGLADHTLVVFSSDNGPEDMAIGNARHSGVGSPGPLRGRKRSLYEGGVRVPFIARWPDRVPAGRVDDTSVLTGVDLLPTACRLAGVDLPPAAELDGEDMGDVLLGRTRPRTRPLFWEWRFHVYGHPASASPSLAVRDGPWKLLVNPDGSRAELHDIPKDPMEVDNRAENEPEVARRLAERVLAWHKTLPEGPWDRTAGRNNYPWPGTPKPKPGA